jgi:hypothetical protein
LKSRWRSWFDAFKHRFVLTPEEKRVALFVLVAFALGLVTKHYRDTHREKPPRIDVMQPRDGGQNTTPDPSATKRKTRKKSSKKSPTPPVALDQSATGAKDD